jgi:hypothetical protein
MTVLRAHFDGKVLIPIDPVDLPVGRELVVRVDSGDGAAATTFLRRLAELAESAPDNPAAAPDRAAQHDHYLYGAPKRP